MEITKQPSNKALSFRRRDSKVLVPLLGEAPKLYRKNFIRRNSQVFSEKNARINRRYIKSSAEEARKRAQK